MKSYRILIVEDDIMTSKLHKQVLEEKGYYVQATETAEDALEILNKNIFEIVLSDHMLPGMSGMEFLKRSKEKYPDSIRLLTTGYAGVDILTEAINEGEIYRFLKKPVSILDLCLTVKTAIKHYELIAENRKFMKELEKKVKKRTRELSKSEEKYRSLVENLNVGVFRNTGIEGKFIEVNPSFVEMFGYDNKEEVLKKEVKDFYVNPEDREKINKKILEESFIKDWEVLLKRKDGSIFNGSITAIAVKDKKNEITYYDGIVENIYKRKKAEDKIKEQREFFSNTINSLNYPFFVIDANTFRIRLANKVVGKLWENKTCYELTHKRNEPCSTEECVCPLSSVKETKQPTIVEHIHSTSDKIKRIIEVHAHPIFDSKGNVFQVIEYHLDITDRKKVEEELSQERLKLESMLKHKSLLYETSAELNMAESLRDVLSETLEIIAERLKITKINLMQFNQEKSELFRFGTGNTRTEERSFNEMESLKISLFSKKFQKKLKNGQVITISSLTELDEEDRKLLEQQNIQAMLAFPVKTSNQNMGYVTFYQNHEFKWDLEIYSIVKALADIISNAWKKDYHFQSRLKTEEKHTEAVMAAENAFRLASIGTLAAGVAHEINQPLTALKVVVDSMLYWGKEKLTEDKAIEKLEFISNQAGRIDDIIQQMRMLSRQEKSTETTGMDINDAARRAISLVERQLKAHDIEFDFKPDLSLPSINGHPIRMQLVVSNLLINAMNALDTISKNNKKITISIGFSRDKCLLKVLDNGPGIPEKNIDQIFQPFFTTKESDDSLGLGLFITQNIVAGFGGTLSVKNIPGGGARFTVAIPVSLEKRGGEK